MFRYFFFSTMLFVGVVSCQTRSLNNLNGLSEIQVAGNKATEVKVCSFNIQFLGHSTIREHKFLAHSIKDCDVVTIQEVTIAHKLLEEDYGSVVMKDKEAGMFFQDVGALGFGCHISSQKTGAKFLPTTPTAMEGYAILYKKKNFEIVGSMHDWCGDEKFSPSSADLKMQPRFISKTLFENQVFERVPYYAVVRAKSRQGDFALINVHLAAGRGSRYRDARASELKEIAAWINQNQKDEKDFFVLGDMNIESNREAATAFPAGFQSLNSKNLNTNINPNSAAPYDHVLYQPEVNTLDIDTASFTVMNLLQLANIANANGLGFIPYDSAHWSKDTDKEFRLKYSDHLPIYFKLFLTSDKD